MPVTSTRTAFACFLAAAAWPWAVGALATLVMSPLDQATAGAWCGMPAHSYYAALGHCAVCWIGSGILIVVGMLLLTSGVARQASDARDMAHFERF